MFLLQERIYLSPATKIINSLFFQSEDFITEQIVREFFLKKVRLGVDEYLSSFKTIAELNKELDDKLVDYKKKKNNLSIKLTSLEKKLTKLLNFKKR